MGFMATIKAQQAMRAHGKGDLEQAKKLYEEAIDKGLMSARPMLGYAILLIREGSYDKAMPLLIKAQKCPDLTPDQKSQLFVDYAACLMKKGELDKAIHLLEKQHNRAPIGLTYQTLGYMYVEKYSGAKPVAEAAPEKAAEALEMPKAPETEASAEEAAEQPKVKTQEDIDREWQEGIDKMFAFIQESVDYDDEDPVCLDNLGQAYYRVTGEKDKAKEWFEKAHAEKDSQIDTLWFLSRYDLEAGDKAAAIAKLEKALDGRFSPLNFCTKDMVQEEVERLKK
jgi:tetratricopeptide (TPR) repeat protein